MFFGFSGLFFFSLTEWLMKRYKAKYLFSGIMFSFTCCTGFTGLIYYIITDNNIFIPVSIFARVMTGATGYVQCFLQTDFLRAQFTDEFERLNGLIFMGMYCGHGVAEAFGCILYDHFGYYAPYILTTSSCLISLSLCTFILPKTKCYVTYEVSCNKDMDDDIENTKNKRVTWLIALPLIATLFINANYGYIQVF